MDSFVALEDVANIVTFIAPGYFALQVYALIYAKRDRDFSRLVIESVIYSLPIVTIANLIWEKLLRNEQVTSLDTGYVVFVLAVAVAMGAIVSFIRTQSPIRDIAARIGLGSPGEDFVKAQLLRIDPNDSDNNAVIVMLKSGQTFSGTADRLSRYTYDGPKYYYFSNLAWFNEKNNKWEERSGGIIVERSEIEYIQTPRLKN